MYYELILIHNLQMSLLEELKHKMNEAEQNYKQNKQNYEDAYNQINKKTDEVKRLVEENKKKNIGMQDVLAKIICAEENYVVAHMALIDAQKIFDTAVKELKDKRETLRVLHDAAMKAFKEEEIEADKTLCAIEKEAKKQKIRIARDEQNTSFVTMYNHPKKELTSMTTAHEALQVAKKIESDALQKYETEKLNFFKAHLTDTLSDIEWKRSNFEMVEVMLKQISVLQACEQKRAEEKRITRAWTFGFICAVFGVALTWFRNKNFEYPLIDVTPPVGYLGMQ
jgi:hypothetical protein